MKRTTCLSVVVLVAFASLVSAQSNLWFDPSFELSSVGVTPQVAAPSMGGAPGHVRVVATNAIKGQNSCELSNYENYGAQIIEYYFYASAGQIVKFSAYIKSQLADWRTTMAIQNPGSPYTQFSEIKVGSSANQGAYFETIYQVTQSAVNETGGKFTAQIKLRQNVGVAWVDDISLTVQDLDPDPEPEPEPEPEPVNLPTPILSVGSEWQSSSPVIGIAWPTGVSLGDVFRVRFDITSSTGHTLAEYANPAAQEFVFSSAQDGNTYKVRALAESHNNELGGYSNEISFQVDATKPSPPFLGSINAGIITVNSQEARLKFTLVQDVGSGVDHIHYQISDSSGFVSILKSGNVLSGEEFTFTVPEQNKEYYVKGLAVDFVGNSSEWSAYTIVIWEELTTPTTVDDIHIDLAGGLNFISLLGESKRVSDVWREAGPDVLLVIHLNTTSGRFWSYKEPFDAPGGTTDVLVTPGMGLVVVMKSGSSSSLVVSNQVDNEYTLPLIQGVNLIGFPLDSFDFQRTKDLVAVEGVSLVTGQDSQGKLVSTPIDMPIDPGKGYVVVASGPVQLKLTGFPWQQSSAAPYLAKNREEVWGIPGMDGLNNLVRAHIGNRESVARPTQTTLFPNYPNPFNPETWIPFQLANPGTVSIQVFDLTGKLVKQLDLGYQLAGSYLNRNQAAYWDGTNNVGEPVASGTYIYRLQADNFSATRRMVILK